MGIKSFTIDGIQEQYEYGSLIGRIASATFSSSSKKIFFRDENNTALFSVSLSALNVEVDSTLAVSGKAADAKATGDAIRNLTGTIPTIDNTLSVSGNAADAKKVGDEIGELKDADNDITDSIGTLSQLATSEKTSLVGAINEVRQNDSNHHTQYNIDKALLDVRLNTLEETVETQGEDITSLSSSVSSLTTAVNGLQYTVATEEETEDYLGIG